MSTQPDGTAGSPEAGQALVVGASSTIGGAIALELAGLGYGLSLWGRDRDRLRATAAACAATGCGVATDRVDVTDRAEVTAALSEVSRRGPLRAVVWAAGLFDWAAADVADPDTWTELLDVNLVAAARITPLVLPQLIASAPSALIYLGSGAARNAYANNAAYVASKHGLAGLAGGTFLDVRDRDVKVSLISPGLVAAGPALWSPAGQQHPERLLQAEDIAAAVRFVVTFPTRGCPIEIQLQPQRHP
jgi:NADP-dependent 3-hydroxy acid dehydrogenase YdfG